MSNKIPFPVKFITVSLIICSLFGNYYFEILGSTLLLLLIFKLFWKEGEPPVIIAALFFQWLSISIGYIYLIFSSASHDELVYRPIYSILHIRKAFWLSIVGLFVFSIGLYLAIKKFRRYNISNNSINKYNTFKIIIVYLVFTLVSESLFRTFRFVLPGIAQPLATLTLFKWSLFFLMIYNSFIKNEYKSLVYSIIIFEVLIGFTSFFSDFKDILMLFPIVYVSFNKMTSKQIRYVIMIALIIFNLGVFWSSIKSDYRYFLSEGKRQQVVLVTKEEAFNRLLHYIKTYNYESYKFGIKSLVQRTYQTEHFAAAIGNIPSNIPYLRGETWSNALKHIFMPRLFFPNKKAIDDSKQTRKLTGIMVSTAEQGVSISIGYMGESYGDFGPVLMFIPIFLLGFIMGKIYLFFIRKAYNAVWAYAMVFPMFFLLNINGMNIIKVVGRLFMFLIVFYLVKKFLVPLIDKYITKKQNAFLRA